MWRIRSPYLVIALAVAVGAFCLTLFIKSPPRPSTRLFTAEELGIYNGSDENLPIFLAVLGSVFDVTKGKNHYGPGGAYNHFAGRDASRAFVSGNFTGDGLTDSLKDLSSSKVKSIVDWRDFYLRTYKSVGRLIGRYYGDHQVFKRS